VARHHRPLEHKGRGFESLSVSHCVVMPCVCRDLYDGLTPCLKSPKNLTGFMVLEFISEMKQARGHNP
jgi:hypothetical protein